MNDLYKIIIYILVLIFLSINLFAIDTVDVRPPLLSIYSDCGNCIITATDNRKLSLSKDSFQLDAGIRDVPVLLKSRSDNYDDIIIDPIYTKDSIYYEMIFELKVLDKFDTAFAVFFVYDNAYNQGRTNVKYDSVKYYPQLIKIDNKELNFGQVYLDSTDSRQISIQNVSGFDFLLKDVYLKYGKYYEITNNVNKNYEFQSEEVLSFNIEYNPKVESIHDPNFDYDTLIIRNECLIYKIPIQGKGVLPRIIVEDFDFGICQVGNSLCKNKSNFPEGIDGLNIYNSGTGILKINNYRFLPDNSPYKLNNPNPDLKNTQLFPKTSINVKSLCFEPSEAGEFFAELILSNNSKGPDSIAYLRGIAYNKGPYLRSLDFGEERVLNKSKKFISIKNSDDKPYYLYQLDLSDNSKGFRIIFEDMNSIPSKENPIAIYPEDSPDNVLKEYLIPIEFLPSEEGFREIKIFPKFIENGVDLELVLFNYIRGTGILPMIEVMGHFFNGKTLVNTFHQDTGYVTIFSRSQYADLYIKSMKVFKQNDNSNDFVWIKSNFPSDTILKKNKSLKFPILFKPEEAGERLLIIQVISDAAKGNTSIWDTTYAEVKGYGFNRILSVDPLNFKDVVHCDSTFGKLVVRNISDTTSTEIFEIEFATNEDNPFEIDKSIFLTQNIILNPGDTIAFDVKFKPFISEKNNYSVMTRVFSDDDTSTTFIKGNSARYKVLLSSDTFIDGMPGMITLDKKPDFIGNNYNINISSKDIQSTFLDSIYFELVYHKNHFRFMNYIEKGDIIQNWNVNFEEIEMNKDTNVLKVLCYGLSPITQNGILVTPAFMIMLGDTNGIRFEIRNVNFFEEEFCNFSDIQDGYINLSYCGEELRKIHISSHLYGLSILNSLPIKDNSLTIAYNIAYEANGILELFNHYGDKIYSFQLGNLKSGKYINQIDLSTLSSGLYFLNFTSGAFSKTEKFIISK